MLIRDSKIYPVKLHRSDLMGQQQRDGVVSVRRNSTIAPFTPFDVRIVAVAGADIGSAERIADTHTSVPAAAAAVDLEPHNTERAASVGWN